jgi:hypothetical protein
MAKFAFLLVTILVLTSATQESGDKSVEMSPNHLSDGLVFDGLLCVIGIVGVPISGIIYGTTRCILKSGLDALTCILEDILVTITASLTVTGVFCFIDPLTVVESYVKEILLKV